jgi:hypothetical protein
MNKNHIVCLKHGTKYGPEYVNALYNMVARNISIDYEFICYTEDARGILPGVRIEPLPSIPSASGWWYKPLFFNPEIGLDGPVLFLDLDIIICAPIDKLFSYHPGSFCIIRDFNRHTIKTYSGFNSSVFRLDNKNHSHVYENFIKSPEAVIKKFRGDQDWIKNQITTDFHFWPDEWIQSYKWEMRPGDLKRGTDGRQYLPQGTPIVKPETSIAVFHGNPNPHDCKDEWCVKNWR